MNDGKGDRDGDGHVESDRPPMRLEMMSFCVFGEVKQFGGLGAYHGLQRILK